MLFFTYPAELVNHLKSLDAKMEVEEGPNGTFRMNLRSHWRETKSIMNQQKWHKANSSRVWKLQPTPEPTKWDILG
jgi:hypothetical protein